jgi:hypothetical protein
MKLLNLLKSIVQLLVKQSMWRVEELRHSWVSAARISSGVSAVIPNWGTSLGEKENSSVYAFMLLMHLCYL